MSSLPPYRSVADGIVTPALFSQRGAQVVASHHQLEQSQWWSPERLREAQASQLSSLLRHAAAHVPYYRETLGSLPAELSSAEFWRYWSELPLLSREQINACGKDLFTTAPLTGHGRQRGVSTSGSTGKPLHTRSTGYCEHFYKIISMRDIHWHRRDLGKKMAAIRPDQKPTRAGIERPGWGQPIDSMYVTGPSALLYSSVAVSRQLDWLLDQQPNYLVSMPSNLKGLAEAVEKRGVALPSLEQLVCYAETLTPQTRSLLERVFGVPVIDMYSSVEVGYIALQCPEHTHYHLQSEVVLGEVLDEHNQPCAPGEAGRLIVTPLHNFASPLIRYEIGDYVEAGAPCPCGRGLPVINRIMGRERNLITLPNGDKHWPYLAIGEWTDFGPILQAQVVQKTLNDLELRLVTERKLKPEEKSALEAYLSKNLRHSFNYTYSYHDSLVRGRSRKFEDFISELPG